MVTRFNPLIPAQLTDPSLLRFPMYLSPKVDGVRCSLHRHFTDPHLPFSRRIDFAKQRVEALGLPWLHVLPQRLVQDAQTLFRTYDQFLAEGFQGAVLRSPKGRYKHGRTSEASQIAIKMKPAETA